MLQRPLELGCDLVMHSTTKYLGGHSDLTGGALVPPADERVDRAAPDPAALGGAVPSAFDCWLLMRGIRTLPWRMRGHCGERGRGGGVLAVHDAVAVVHYPGFRPIPVMRWQRGR